MTNIEINCEHEAWYKAIPGVEELIIKAAIHAVNATTISEYASEIEISVMLADDKFVQNLNSEYRGKDKPTNVLSFPPVQLVAGEYEDIGEFAMLGDIVFALETIQREAEEQDKTLSDHLSHLAVHGTLHLLGYDHMNDEEAEVMEALEVEILGGMGIADPY
jgi:probable rRNA maturation factor